MAESNNTLISEDKADEGRALLAEGRAVLEQIRGMGLSPFETAEAKKMVAAIEAKMNAFPEPLDANDQQRYSQLPIIEELRRRKFSQPFQPFVIMTKDDKVARVPTADHIAIAPVGSLVVVFTQYGTANLMSVSEMEHASNWFLE